MILFVGLVAIGLLVFFQIIDLFKENTKLIELYVLIDKDGRMTYTGTYKDCKRQLTNEVKLIKLEGIIE